MNVNQKYDEMTKLAAYQLAQAINAFPENLRQQAFNLTMSRFHSFTSGEQTSNILDGAGLVTLIPDPINTPDQPTGEAPEAV